MGLWSLVIDFRCSVVDSAFRANWSRCVLQSSQSAGADFFGGSRSRYRQQEAQVSIEVDQRLGVALVCLHPDGNGFGTVVIALVQAAATAIADTVNP